MERAKARYTILGLSDGMFFGLGLSLGVSFLHSYQITFASIIISGISGSLSNLFSVYNAETFIAMQQLHEYREALFEREYSPKKLTEEKRKKVVSYSEISFVSTLVGSVIVLLPYSFMFLIGIKNFSYAGLYSLLSAMIVLFFIGFAQKAKLNTRVKRGIKNAGIGFGVSVIAFIIGYIVSTAV